ncbi:head-tail connector protein [Sinorhizobium meliloti]|uniref:head-tail connector protein n=1 Tax=Rhizobium meliloti TaxID=382 RepID=UPI000FE03CA0|nr:head-tail connector protein [Sinorhizobium meliloti]RVL53950.1 hypothetical protein CN141_25535 [Sinorhizobium meliloti]
MLAPRLVTPPATRPVSLEEAKVQCRIDVSEAIENAIIEGYIDAATQQLEKILDLALVTQTWEQDFATLCRQLRLPKAPVSGTPTVKYYNAQNVEQTFAPANYRVLTDLEGTYLSIPPEVDVPETFARPDAVTVQFTAGAPADEIPASLKTAILLHVAFLYQFRESSLDASVTPTGAYESLVWPFKRTEV